ncbi:MAG: imidazoleglycerol-phosphate dehydratase HisB [Anaerovoracaceae bacterium]|jgi:imidazoleglycerol-phosphate dehydratase
MREYSFERRTKETVIKIDLNLDGSGNHNIDTGIGFFDHMLEAFSLHSGIDLEVKCEGDLYVDNHHTIEDVGISIGIAFLEATKNKRGIERYGSAMIPMDEALALCNVDISGRPYLVFNGGFEGNLIGEMETQMVKEFFYAFAINARVTLHINILYGNNDHHKAEAIYKAFAHAIKNAIKIKKDNDTILSTKGIL